MKFSILAHSTFNQRTKNLPQIVSGDKWVPIMMHDESGDQGDQVQHSLYIILYDRYMTYHSVANSSTLLRLYRCGPHNRMSKNKYSESTNFFQGSDPEACWELRCEKIYFWTTIRKAESLTITSWNSLRCCFSPNKRAWTLATALQVFILIQEARSVPSLIYHLLNCWSTW